MLMKTDKETTKGSIKKILVTLSKEDEDMIRKIQRRTGIKSVPDILRMKLRSGEQESNQPIITSP